MSSESVVDGVTREWIGLVDARLPTRLGLARSSDDSLNAGELRHAAGPGDSSHWRVRRARLGSQQSLSEGPGYWERLRTA